MKKVFKIIGVLFGFFLIGVIGLYSYLYFTVLDNPFDNKDFDKVVWLKFHNDMNPDNPRGEMYESLVDNHLKKGMSKMNIVRLLGKPDIKEDNNFYSYNLGMWSGFRIDYDSLDLKFSENGQLVEFYRVQH